VRDALRILETRVLVSLRANAGARVASLTVRDMELSYQIRELLEPIARGEHPASDRRGFRDDARRQGEYWRQWTMADAYMPLARAFHWTAFNGHQVPLLAQIVERLWDTTHHYPAGPYAVLALQDQELRGVMRAERDLLFGANHAARARPRPRILSAHIRRTHHRPA
jgi:DNA-binding GntR family transcriptional regulator